MAKILLGVTGSVAAIKTLELHSVLRSRGHMVKIVATRAALYFFDPANVHSALEGDAAQIVRDEDEWPGREAGLLWQRGDPVLHIELRRWADLLLIAPLDANTLAKIAMGLCDNCLTSLWRAWEPARPVLLAPAMNTLMWQHPATARHLRQLAADAGAPASDALTLPEVLDWINSRCPRLRIVPPDTKRLACNDEGVGALAPLEVIADRVDDLLASIT